MESVKYTKVMDVEKVGDMYPPPPPPPPPHYGDECLPDCPPPKPARTHFLKSILAAFFCCFPAGLLGVFFSVRTYCANKAGDFKEARNFSKWAKRLVILAVVAGTAMTILALGLHACFIFREIHRAKHAFRDGLVYGIADGKVAGAQYVEEHLNHSSSELLVLPEKLPENVNVFDVRKSNPFWVEVHHALRGPEKYQAATPFGYQFGWTHGFKVGFCGSEGTNCTGVFLKDSHCPFKAVFGELLPPKGPPPHGHGHGHKWRRPPPPPRHKHDHEEKH